MANVFLSYQKRDRDLAERMAAALKAEGLSVWWDDDLTPRESWDRTIEREIAAAEHVLVLWTKHSVESDWVRIEANYARNCEPSKLIQARFDDVTIPMAFSMIQYVDLVRSTLHHGAPWQKVIGWLGAGDESSTVQAEAMSAPPEIRPAPNPSYRNTTSYKKRHGFEYSTPSKRFMRSNVSVSYKGISAYGLDAVNWKQIRSIIVSYKLLTIKIITDKNREINIESWGKPGEFRRVVGAIASWIEVIHE